MRGNYMLVVFILLGLLIPNTALAQEDFTCLAGEEDDYWAEWSREFRRNGEIDLSDEAIDCGMESPTTPEMEIYFNIARGQNAFLRGDFEAALHFYRLANPTMDYTDEYILVTLASYSPVDGNTFLQYANEAVDAAPDTESLILALQYQSFALSRLERYEEAAGVYDKIIDLSGSHVNEFDLYAYGNTLFNAGRYLDAFDAFEKSYNMVDSENMRESEYQNMAKSMVWAAINGQADAAEAWEWVEKFTAYDGSDCTVLTEDLGRVRLQFEFVYKYRLESSESAFSLYETYTCPSHRITVGTALESLGEQQLAGNMYTQAIELGETGAYWYRMHVREVMGDTIGAAEDRAMAESFDTPSEYLSRPPF